MAARFYSCKVALTLIFLVSLITSSRAQGPDKVNHFKGLLSNRFDSLEKWSLHFQFTDIVQGHPAFRAAYSGTNSLHDTAESAMSVTSTLFLGRKLWKYGSIFLDEEIAGGKGMSYALGLAGAANGETFRVGNPAPALYTARFFFEQHIAIGTSKTEHRFADKNQMAGNVPESRITITVGKFSLADFFDDNAYAHDPRSEFMNWALMDNGAWDYPANTRGYTWGATVEYIKPKYIIRLSSTLVPKIANSEVFDLNIRKANGNTAEFERILLINNHPGNIRFLGYANFSRAPTYNSAISGMQAGDSILEHVIQSQIAGLKYGGVKYGFGMSFNQELADNIGMFSRLGWNDGNTATWAFTEIDRTASAGLRVNGSIINRPFDVGVAGIVNGISAPHRNYLNAGGYGFILGDGKLNYGLEHIVEVFFKEMLLQGIWVTLDYQFVANPGYNRDRGPVNIFAIRTHVEF